MLYLKSCTVLNVLVMVTLSGHQSCCQLSPACCIHKILFNGTHSKLFNSHAKLLKQSRQIFLGVGFYSRCHRILSFPNPAKFILFTSSCTELQNGKGIAKISRRHVWLSLQLIGEDDRFLESIKKIKIAFIVDGSQCLKQGFTQRWVSGQWKIH